jgi:Ca2+-binding EF-hand superfamily protein
MPGPRNLHQNQAILQLLAHKQSPPPKSSRSRPIDYPWETKITPPPPRKKETNVDPSEEEAFQRIFRALRLEAYRRSGETKKEDDEKNAKAREEAAAKQAAAAEAQFQADAATIADAVQRALDKEQLQAIKTATELATLEKEQRVKRAAMEDTAEKLKASKDSTLKLKLGHAIAKRNISTAALMRLWDANGDGNLTKEEFMQALQRTLKLEATLKEMSALFDSFDEDRGGSITINELQPAVARLHEDCRDEALKEKLSRLKVAVYDLELAKLKDCLDVAREWESILKQRSELTSKRTVVEDLGKLLSEKVERSKNTSKKLLKGSGNADTPEYLAGELAGEGSFKNKKLSKGSGNAVTPEYLAGELAGEGGMVSRTSFMKFAVRRHRHRTLVRSPLLLCAHAWCRRVLTA